MTDGDETIMTVFILGKRLCAFVHTNYEIVLNVPRAQLKSIHEIKKVMNKTKNKNAGNT